jgi:hypothetical protein
MGARHSAAGLLRPVLLAAVVASLLVVALMLVLTGSALADASPYATISGQVTDVEGNGLAGITVSASSDGSAVTGADGRYSIAWVDPGDHDVSFYEAPGGAVASRNLVALKYGQRTPFDQAVAVHVIAGEAHDGIDAQLHVGGTVTGTITDAQGDPVAGIGVVLDGTALSAESDAAGHYAITNAEPGSYSVRVEPSTDSGYLPQSYGGVPTSGLTGLPPPPPAPRTLNYAPVVVVAGATTGSIDVQLVSAGAITGTVTDDQGRPLAGVQVDVAPPGIEIVRGGWMVITTDAAGAYRIDQLVPGTWHVLFSAPGYARQDYGAPGGVGAPIDVAAGQTVTGIDVRMPLAGSISGIVTDVQGTPMNAFIWAYGLDGTVAGMSASNASGFTLENLAPGLYHVLFNPLNSVWIGGFYSRTPGGAPDLVQVVAGQTTTGIDGHQPAPAAAATIPSAAAAIPSGAAASRPQLERFHGTLSVSRAGTVAFSLRCSGPTACTGTASLSVGSTATAATRGHTSAARVAIGHARFAVTARRAAPVQLRLSRTGRAMLRRHHGRLTAALDITAAGGVATKTVTARLRSRR